MILVRLVIALAFYAAIAYSIYRLLKRAFRSDDNIVNGIDVRELTGKDRVAILMGYLYLPDYGAEVTRETADKLFERIV